MRVMILLAAYDFGGSPNANLTTEDRVKVAGLEKVAFAGMPQHMMYPLRGEMVKHWLTGDFKGREAAELKGMEYSQWRLLEDEKEKIEKEQWMEGLSWFKSMFELAT
jgi:hypothetical protein